VGGQTLTALVHGEAGTGKSWLGDTAPAPRLILDAEGRAKYLPSQPKVEWDPRHQNPPAADGTWETCVATVPNFDLLEHVYQWLQSGQHGFRSVVVDSIMEVQKRLIDSIAGIEALDQQDWGVVLKRLEALVRNYRDLTMSPSNPVDCVVFTVGSKPVDGKQRPMLQGQLSITIPYLVDIVGYLYNRTDPEDPTKIHRAMLISPTTTAVAKDGTNRLPSPAVAEPNLTTIFGMLNGGSPAAEGVTAGVQSQTQTTAAEGEGGAG
jgi:hypothetical protein